MVEKSSYPTILITRPREDATAFADLLIAHGFMPMLAPMLDIRMRAAARAQIMQAFSHALQAVVATSRHGVTAVAAMTARRNIPMFVVSEASAHAAHEAGFQLVHRGGGTAESLVVRICQICAPVQGPLLYASGRHTAHDIGYLLGRRGFSVNTVVVYDAISRTQLDSDVRHALRHNEVGGVTFFSARTAAAFLDCLERTGLSYVLPQLCAICLSDTIAGSIAGAQWQAVITAPEPNLESMAATVDNAFSNRGSS